MIRGAIGRSNSEERSINRFLNIYLIAKENVRERQCQRDLLEGQKSIASSKHT